MLYFQCFRRFLIFLFLNYMFLIVKHVCIYNVLGTVEGPRRHNVRDICHYICSWLKHSCLFAHNEKQLEFF